jgi:hypothetical protein
MDIHMIELLVPEPSLVKVEISVGELKRYKSLGSDQIPVELLEAGGETLCSEVHKLICPVWNKKELPQQWEEYIIVPFHKKGDMTDCNNYQGISLLSAAYRMLPNILLARLTPYVNEVIGDRQCGFYHNIYYRSDFLHSADTREKWGYNGMVHQLFIYFKKAYDSVKREVIYNILLEFGIPKKLFRLIKMCLNETYRKVHVGKLLSDEFPI